MQDAKEEVRSRLNIEDVIGEYMELRRAGRNFKGLSPFSQEKTPSFFVSPDKHIWHDFSSNRGGDVFSFVMEVEGIDFRAALELLARKAGVDLSMFSNSGGGKDMAKKKARLSDLLALATQYYQQSLLRNAHALDYVVKKRKLNKQMITEFGIGYSPSQGGALTEFLLKKGYSRDEIQGAGLLNRYGGDFFRGRMMVSLADGQGQPIGFTARQIADVPDSPKYINTPQTLLYDKSRHVFGLHLAKEAIRRSDYSVIVEGNMDVISSHQVGVAQVVATAGTALTQFHLRALVRLSNNVRLAFDADRAGLAATERAIPIAQEVGVNLQIITLGEGVKDPDELIQKDVALWQTAIERSRPAIDWVLEQYSIRYDLTSAAGKREFTTEALRLINSIKDGVEREHYMGVVSEMTGASLDVLTQKSKTATEQQKKPLKPIAPATHGAEKQLASHAYADNFLALTLLEPDTRSLLTQTDARLLFEADRGVLAEYVQKHHGQRVDDTPEELQKIDIYVKIILLRADARYGTWSSEDRLFEAAKLLRQLKTQHLKDKKAELTSRMRDAEATGDDATIAQTRSEMNTLIKELGNAQR